MREVDILVPDEVKTGRWAAAPASRTPHARRQLRYALNSRLLYVLSYRESNLVAVSRKVPQQKGAIRCSQSAVPNITREDRHVSLSPAVVSSAKLGEH